METALLAEQIIPVCVCMVAVTSFGTQAFAGIMTVSGALPAVGTRLLILANLVLFCMNRVLFIFRSKDKNNITGKLFVLAVAVYGIIGIVEGVGIFRIVRSVFRKAVFMRWWDRTAPERRH
jgi:hypothetical protein